MHLLDHLSRFHVRRVGYKQTVDFRRVAEMDQRTQLPVIGEL